MENIGDWLYIVLMAVAVVSSLLSAGRKKKREAEQRETHRPEVETAPAGEKSIWDVMREMQEQEEAKQRQARQPQQQAAKSATRRAASPFLAGEKVSGHVARPPVPAVEPEPSPLVEKETFNNPDELRKAVLYSEILNRKY